MTTRFGARGERGDGGVLNEGFCGADGAARFGLRGDGAATGVVVVSGVMGTTGASSFCGATTTDCACRDIAPPVKMHANTSDTRRDLKSNAVRSSRER